MRYFIDQLNDKQQPYVSGWTLGQPYVFGFSSHPAERYRWPLLKPAVPPTLLRNALTAQTCRSQIVSLFYDVTDDLLPN